MPLAYLLFGVALLAALLLLARWFTRADPATLVAVVKWVGGTLAALVALYLIVSGRGAWLFGLIFFLFPFLRRLLRGGGASFGGFGFPGRERPSPGQSSGVETAYLRMTLDHDSGHMEGTVLQGPFAGRELSSLGLDELLSVLAECARADAQSARVLESYLDRSDYGDWRERMEARERGAGKAAMTPEEAREILGVGADATAEEIKEAHRRLMQAYHPDHGGSTYLAARINLAKEVLLGT
ncbi:MAG: DnaJ domain-containing protein [Alphaproteobacteria bacterium]